MRTFGKGLVVAATVATALCATGLVQARSERPARTLDVAPVTKTWTSGLSVSKTASGVRSVATTYTWSVSKNTSTSSLSLRPGQSASASYTINATRTESGSTTTDDVSGSISIANASTV